MQMETNGSRDTFFFIPHTHWEGAVFKTREEYLDMGLPNILRALRLLKQYPDYRFVLDQAAYVRPFLERYPEECATVKQFVDEGRLAITGGLDVMPDVNMPCGETFARQALYGKRYFREALGVDVTTGWQLDTFGHHAQMPQLMRLAGFNSFWFFRGVASWDVPAEFFWEGLDGTQIPAYWLAHGYAVTFDSPKTLPEFTKFFKERYELLAPFARGEGRVGPAGADVCEPEAHVPALVQAFNAQMDAPFNIQIATPADYEAFVDMHRERPVVRGELNPIFQGTYSSRIKLKQLTREIEGLLTTAEKLGVILAARGVTSDEERLWGAWEPMMFNHTHDLMSGVMTDHVYEDTLHSYEYSRHIAREEMESRLQALNAQIDTRGEGIGIAVSVFNPLNWARSETAIVNAGFTAPGVMDVAVTDAAGQRVPSQLLDAERDADGALLRARVAFIAQNVPALGYALYRLHPVTTTEATSEATGGESLENDYYRAEIDPLSGAITRLTDKATGWDVLRGAGNVVAREDDHGDLWEPYVPLDGGSRIAMKNQHLPPEPGQAVFSTDQAAEPGRITRGPVCSEFTVIHPFGAAGRFGTTIRLYAGSRRIDIQTRILNDESFVRYRALFPTSIQNGRITREIPFGASEQPDGIEFPAQNWMDCDDGQRGVALLNRGLPGNNAAGGTLMLSLMRSSAIVAYGFGGGYEPGMSSDSGLELNKSFTFDYALLPHDGDWRAAQLVRAGLEFNNPLMARTLDAHPGALPGDCAPVKVDHPAIVVTALKADGDGSTILRMYETMGQPANGVLVKAAGAIAAEEVNLIEDPLHVLAVSDGAIRLDFRPFEIKTVKLKFA
jgi:alpha-mannosidase